MILSGTSLGKRHNEAARIAGRGQYALFSPKPHTPSQRATHLLYYLTHPAPDKIGEIQEELSIYVSGSFIIQVRMIPLGLKGTRIRIDVSLID